MNNKQIKPPNTLSGLLELALKDLEAVRKDPRYAIDMWEWHSPRIYGGVPVCYVCLAGCVLANTFGAEVDHMVSPSYLKETQEQGDRWHSCMYSLDDLREGNVSGAAITMGLTCAVPDREVTSYKSSPDGFMSDMYVLLEELREWDNVTNKNVVITHE